MIPGSEITFTGADKTYRCGGMCGGIPLYGAGHVNFVGTTLQFEPSSIPGDESKIHAGAFVAFHGDNVVKSSQALLDLDRQGRLNAPFIFQSGDQVVDNAILGASDAVWNATGRKLSLINGAKFINVGRFVIQAKVGNSLFIDSGITSDNSAVLFHNTSTGRLVHDINDTTDFNVNFLNDGFLEFRRGTFNFRKNFSGRGGIAASNGAQLNLSLVGVPLDQQPQMFELNGAGSRISVNLGSGQTLAASVTVNGGQMVAAGGLNMVAAGGLNLVAAGGGNILTANGMNMVGMNGGSISATGINSLIGAQGGGNLIGNDGSTLIGNDGSTLVGLDGGSLIGNDGSTLIGNDGSTLAAIGGGDVDIGSGSAAAPPRHRGFASAPASPSVQTKRCS